MLPEGVSDGEAWLYYKDFKFSSGSNHYELLILPNGSLFITEAFLSKILDKAGPEGLIFLILTEMMHLYKGHTLQNLHKK